MNWFWFALIALICWSGSDLFSKIGCCGEKDKTAHLKMVVAVGLVMGLHAAYMIVFHHVSVTWDVVWTYLPVSLLYILSMTLGYVGAATESTTTISTAPERTIVSVISSACSPQSGCEI